MTKWICTKCGKELDTETCADLVGGICPECAFKPNGPLGVKN